MVRLFSKWTRAHVVTTIVGIISGCANDVAPSRPNLNEDGVPQGEYAIANYPIIRENNRLFVFTFNCSCEGEMRKKETHVSVYPFALDGKHLTVTWTTQQVGDSNILVTYYQKYQRQSADTSLTGTWQHVVAWYEADAPLTADDSISCNAQLEQILTPKYEWLVFSETRLKVYFPLQTVPDFVTKFFINWAKIPGGNVIDTVRVSGHTALLVNRMSGDTVHVEVDSLGDITWTWTTVDPMQTHVFYNDYRHCPNSYEPAWLPDFLGTSH